MLLTTRQVAEKLGIGDSRVRQLIYEGRIRAIKIGQYNLVEEKDAHYERKHDYPRKPRQRREK